jgi:hypothetical protein
VASFLCTCESSSEHSDTDMTRSTASSETTRNSTHCPDQATRRSEEVRRSLLCEVMATGNKMAVFWYVESEIQTFQTVMLHRQNNFYGPR